MSRGYYWPDYIAWVALANHAARVALAGPVAHHAAHDERQALPPASVRGGGY